MLTLPSVEFLLCSAQNSQVSIASDSRDSARIVMIVQYSTKLVPSICRCWSRYIIQCLVVTMNPFVMRGPAHTSPYQPIPAHTSPYQHRPRYRGHRYPDRSLLTIYNIHCIHWTTRRSEVGELSFKSASAPLPYY